MFYTYDNYGFYTGTSETETPNSTSKPYPDGIGFFRFAYGDWKLIFGADVNGDLTIEPTQIAPRPSFEAPTRQENPAYPELSVDTLTTLFNLATIVISETKLYKAHTVVGLAPSYGLYRKGDFTYFGVGMTWVTTENRVFNAKVVNNAVTDIYEVFKEGDYIWKELDQDTFEPVALYTREGDFKHDPVTLEVLQENQSTKNLNELPQPFIDEINLCNLPYADYIWQYGNKPYGEVVAFYVPGI